MACRVGFVTHSPRILSSIPRNMWASIQQELPSIAAFKPTVVYLESAEGVSDEEKKRIEDLDVIFTCPRTFGNLGVFDCLSNLKWLHVYSAGVDRIVNYYKHKPHPSFLFTRNIAFFDSQICTLLLAWICCRERRLQDYKQQQHLKIWQDLPCRLMEELVVGIVGYGSIGKKLASMCSVWEVDVVALVREKEDGGAEEVSTSNKSVRITTDIKELLTSCHYLVSLLPATPSTNSFFDHDLLKNCHNNSPVFINMGRGNVISEESLIRALHNKWISHALLDVFPVEPLPASSALWQRDDVTILPHVAATLFPTKKFIRDIQEKYELWLQGKPIPGTVDWNKMY